jgi:hypothetical protein
MASKKLKMSGKPREIEKRLFSGSGGLLDWS